jgi:hypothetical protein
MIGFLERQRVHVGADGDDRFSAPKFGNHPGPPDAAPEANPKLLQDFGHLRSRTRFPEAKFRVHVEVAPPDG